MCRKAAILFCLLPLSILSFAQLQYAKIFVLGNAATPVKIQTLFQSSKGILYCGASNGLYLFDGINYIKIKQADSLSASVTAICENSNGDIITGYESGMIGILMQNKITPFPMEEGYPKVAIKSLACAGNENLWIGTAGEGLYLKTRKHLLNFNTDDGLSDNYIYKIILLDSMRVMTATDRGINICKWQAGKKNIQIITARNGLPDNIVRAIARGNDGSFWAGLQDAGVAKIDPGGHISHITPHWQYGAINDLLFYNNLVLAATEENGLVYFDPTVADKQTVLQNDVTLARIAAICVDKSGAVWFAGNNQLAFAESLLLQQIFSFQQQNKDFVYNLLAVSADEIWYWYEKGLAAINKKGTIWTEKKFPLPGIANKQVSALYRHTDGTLWIGTLGHGVYIFNPKTGIAKPLQPDAMKDKINITSITGFDNEIWIASFEGLVKIKTLHDGYDVMPVQGAGNKYVYHVFADSKKRIWLATDGDGIALYDQGKMNWFKNIKGYRGKGVYKITEDASGKIWYATYDAGVVCYDFKQFRTWNEKDGLSEESVTGLAAYNNRIFVFHSQGIDVMNTKTGALDYIDKESGIDSLRDDLNAYSISPDGQVFFVSSNKLYTFHTRNYRTQLPEIYINKIELYLKEGQYPNGHSFKHDQNNLGFYYTGIFYPHPERLRYAYKLDGYDKEWVPTNDKVKVFPKLPPGRYNFRIKTGLGDNLANAREASFAFVIKEPFWLQTWFVIALIITLGGIIYLIVHYREQQIRKWNTLQTEKINLQLQTLRNQINPHFLFNSFNTLVSEIETQPEQAVEYVEKLSDFYRSVVICRDKDLIPLEEELQILRDYIYLQQKRFQTALQVSIKLDTAIKRESFIPPLALQLLVENAIKHNVVSKENPLLIEVLSDDRYITVSNSIQYKTKPEAGTGMGLDNLANRYLLLSGSKIIIENDHQFFRVKIPYINSYYGTHTYN